MSRSNPNDQLVNPCTRWFQWSGDLGVFREYDKETKTNKNVPFPFKFLVLEKDTFTITGFNESEGVGYYSNEVKSSKDKLTVRTKSGIVGEGTYEEIKAKLSSKGAKYCQSVYIMFYDENKNPTLGNIKITGAALGPWIDLQKVAKVMECGLVVKGSKEGKKGKVVYQMPTFETMKVSEASNKAAIELDKTLQEYLKAYFEKNKTTAPVSAPVIEEEKPEVKTEAKVQTKKEPIIESTPDIVTNDSEEAPF